MAEAEAEGKGAKCPVAKCTIVMSTVNSDDCFCESLIFVLHDCQTQ